MSESHIHLAFLLAITNREGPSHFRLHLIEFDASGCVICDASGCDASGCFVRLCSAAWRRAMSSGVGDIDDGSPPAELPRVLFKPPTWL